MRARCNSSTSNTAYSVFFISAAATPRSKLEPEGLVVTLPNLEIALTSALVVEVLPFVPEIQMILRPLASSEIAFG